MEVEGADAVSAEVLEGALQAGCKASDLGCELGRVGGRKGRKGCFSLEGLGCFLRTLGFAQALRWREIEEALEGCISAKQQERTEVFVQLDGRTQKLGAGDLVGARRQGDQGELGIVGLSADPILEAALAAGGAQNLDLCRQAGGFELFAACAGARRRDDLGHHTAAARASRHVAHSSRLLKKPRSDRPKTMAPRSGAHHRSI